MMQELDRGVGELVATLHRLGLAENTLVFFTSDNGATAEGSNGRLRGRKASLWEGGHRVPAIAAWPGRIAPGRVTEQTAVTMDLLPTLLELSGAAAPPDRRLDGISLAPLLLRNEPLPERMIFWGYNRRFAVRHGPWKLVANPVPPEGAKQRRKASAGDPALGLYTLDSDPGETNNLADTMPDVARRLQDALAAWQSDVGYGRAR
jgi:arylsulfatase A-like enzyme